MADEEIIDQKRYIEELSKPKCVKRLVELQPWLPCCRGCVSERSNNYFFKACEKRIEGDDTGSKHCTGQYFDYWSCIDKCVASKLFPTLK